MATPVALRARIHDLCIQGRRHESASWVVSRPRCNWFQLYDTVLNTGLNLLQFKKTLTIARAQCFFDW